MSTEVPAEEKQSPERVLLAPLAAGFWTARRLAVATLVVCGVAYLVFRGAPAVGFVFARIREVSITVVLAIVLAYVVAPLVEVFWALPPFSRSRQGRVAAALLVFVLLTAGVVSLLVLTADPIVRESVRLSGLASEWLEDAPHRVDRWLRAYSATVPPAVADVINRRVSDLASSAVEWTTRFAARVVYRGWYLVEALLIPVLAFYFVTDSDRLLQSLLGVVPERHHARIRLFARDVDRTLHAYVRGQLILCLIAAVVTAVALYLLGVRVYLTLGILAGLSRAVPVIGPIIAAVPIVGITLIQCGPQAALAALIIFVVMHFAESKLLMPKVIGHEAELHPVVVIMALLIGGEFLGILGMFVAVPIVAILRVGFVHWRAARRDAEAAA
jgi:predicted PurR-regulated permease PerM